jgi:anti-sigma factor RsiW
MAYADGELEGPLAAHIREAIGADTAVRQKFEIYSGSRRLLASVFEGVLSESVPDRLRETVAPARRRKAR